MKCFLQSGNSSSTNSEEAAKKQQKMAANGEKGDQNGRLKLLLYNAFIKGKKLDTQQRTCCP